MTAYSKSTEVLPLVSVSYQFNVGLNGQGSLKLFIEPQFIVVIGTSTSIFLKFIDFVKPPSIKLTIYCFGDGSTYRSVFHITREGLYI